MLRPAVANSSHPGRMVVPVTPRQAPLAAVASAAVIVAMFGLGAWSFNAMRESTTTLHPARHQLQSRNAARSAGKQTCALCHAAKGLAGAADPGPHGSTADRMPSSSSLSQWRTD